MSFLSFLLCQLRVDARQIVYNHQVFNSVGDFMGAFRNGTLKRLPARPDNHDYDWTTRKRPEGPRRDLDYLPGPRSVSFAGLRFRVDKCVPASYCSHSAGTNMVCTQSYAIRQLDGLGDVPRFR